MSKKPLFLGLLCLSMALCLGLFCHGESPARAEGVFKDLQVLPKDTPKPALKAIMKKQAKAMGTDCDHCHKEPDMAADTDNKKIARDMMRMTDDLNKKYFATSKQKVTCMTCHHGHEKPQEN